MRASSLPDGLGDAFSVRAAGEAGVSRSRMRARDLDRPFHGVRARRLDVEPEVLGESAHLARVLQYAHRMTEHEFFSHVSAAIVWGLPLPHSLVVGRPVDVCVHRPRRAPAGRGVRGATVVRSLAHVVSHRPETWLRLLIEDAGLPAAHANFDVYDRGVWLAQVDLAYPDLRIAIEYEGEHHLTDPAQWAKDIARIERLIEAGWRVIRVTKGDVFRDPTGILDRIRRAIAHASH